MAKGDVALIKTLTAQSDKKRGWEQNNTFKENLGKVEADADGCDWCILCIEKSCWCLLVLKACRNPAQMGRAGFS